MSVEILYAVRGVLTLEIRSIKIMFYGNFTVVRAHGLVRVLLL